MHFLPSNFLPRLVLALVLGSGVGGAAAASDAPAFHPGAASVTTNAVPRPPRRLEEAELCKLLTDYLNEDGGATGAEWELRFTRPWTPVSVPDEPLKVELLEPALNRITATSILRFEIRAGRLPVGVWQVPVHARLWREVVIAEAALQRGQLLSEVAVAHVRRDVLALREPLFELPLAAEAYELAESVPLGAALTMRSLRLKPVVFRGQTANAIMVDSAMTIALKVEVMEEGVPGQIVRVRNLQTRRELRGKVKDEQTIAISF